MFVEPHCCGHRTPLSIRLKSMGLAACDGLSVCGGETSSRKGTVE